MENPISWIKRMSKPTPDDWLTPKQPPNPTLSPDLPNPDEYKPVDEGPLGDAGSITTGSHSHFLENIGNDALAKQRLSNIVGGHGGTFGQGDGDVDNDGIPDAVDTDIDGDGIPDVVDPYIGADIDGNGEPDNE